MKLKIKKKTNCLAMTTDWLQYVKWMIVKLVTSIPGQHKLTVTTFLYGSILIYLMDTFKINQYFLTNEELRKIFSLCGYLWSMRKSKPEESYWKRLMIGSDLVNEKSSLYITWNRCPRELVWHWRNGMFLLMEFS